MLPVLECQFLRGGVVRTRPHVVDECGHATEPLVHVVEQRRDLVFFRHVRSNERAFASVLGHQFVGRGPVFDRFSPDVGDDDVGSALVAGEAFFEQFRDPYLTDERVRSLAERVTANHDPALDAAYPDKWGARATVTLVDGTEHTAAFDTCRGDPGNMPTPDELETKVRALAGRSVDADAIDALLEATGTLESVENVDAITDRLS